MNSQTKRREILGIDADCDDSESYAIDLQPIVESVYRIAEDYREGRRHILSALDALTECRHEVGDLRTLGTLSPTAERMEVAATAVIEQRTRAALDRRLSARLAAQEQARIRRRAQAREIARRHNKEGAR